MTSLQSDIHCLENKIAINRSSLQHTYRRLKQSSLHEITKPKTFVLAFLGGFGLVYFSQHKTHPKPEKIPLIPALSFTSNLVLLGERLKKLFLF